MTRQPPRFDADPWTCRDIVACLFGAAGLALILLFLAVTAGLLR